jgi:hypothetical protein
MPIRSSSNPGQQTERNKPDTGTKEEQRCPISAFYLDIRNLGLTGFKSRLGLAESPTVLVLLQLELQICST